MTAEEYLMQEWNCEADELELVHVATLQAFMDKYGIDSTEGIDALIISSQMCRVAAQNAPIRP